MPNRKKSNISRKLPLVTRSTVASLDRDAPSAEIAVMSFPLPSPCYVRQVPLFVAQAGRRRHCKNNPTALASNNLDFVSRPCLTSNAFLGWGYEYKSSDIHRRSGSHGVRSAQARDRGRADPRSRQEAGRTSVRRERRTAGLFLPECCPAMGGDRCRSLPRDRRGG